MIIWRWFKLFDALRTGCTDERQAKLQTARLLRAKTRIDKKYA